jgi:hypothetical protein
MNEKSVFSLKKVRTDICENYKGYDKCDSYDNWSCVYHEDKTCAEWENCPHYANGDDNMVLVGEIENKIQRLAFPYLSKIEGLDFCVWYCDEDWCFDICLYEVSEKKDKNLIAKVENAIQEFFHSRKWNNYLKKHSAVITKAKFDKQEIVYDHLSYRVFWEKQEKSNIKTK